MEKGYAFMDAICAYEAGQLPEKEIYKLFQFLLVTGKVYGLQGAYQRKCQDLLDEGKISLPESEKPTTKRKPKPKAVEPDEQNDGEDFAVQAPEQE
jgi:hypothetical protein